MGMEKQEKKVQSGDKKTFILDEKREEGNVVPAEGKLSRRCGPCVRSSFQAGISRPAFLEMS